MRVGVVREYAGVFLIMAGLLLLTSLLSHTPQDPVGFSGVPVPVANMGGRLGATVSDISFSFFGRVAYLICIPVFCIGLLLIRPRREYLGSGKYKETPEDSEELWNDIPPPNTALYLLFLGLSKRDRQAVPGDLEQEYREDVLPRFGPRRAKFWFWVQTCRALWHLVPIRVLRFFTAGWVIDLVRRKLRL